MDNSLIVIPNYKSKFNHNETLVLKNLIGLYGTDMLCFVCPESLKIDNEFEDISTVKFDDRFFKSVESYNQLMLSLEFYKHFNNYDYILIHQLDAYIFSDELQFWCQQNYDYIGAPWLSSHNFLSSLFYSKRKRERTPIFNNVGNGGFSLRRVSTFINFIENHAYLINKYKDHKLYGIEDVFWSLIAPKHVKMKIPDLKIASKFALDRKPELGLKMNNFELPFGCHGFEKSKTKSFWKNHIKELI